MYTSSSRDARIYTPVLRRSGRVGGLSRLLQAASISFTDADDGQGEDEWV